MLIISHRGNLDGREEKLENSPEYIESALYHGFDVEIDVWYLGDSYYLGHDEPKHKVYKDFLLNGRLWCHAKNIEALQKMIEEGIHCFWHENDKLTLTSKKIPWCFPGTYLETGITVMKDKQIPPYKIKGMCTDYPLLFA
jgi:hypothetical protein